MWIQKIRLFQTHVAEKAQGDKIQEKKLWAKDAEETQGRPVKFHSSQKGLT